MRLRAKLLLSLGVCVLIGGSAVAAAFAIPNLFPFLDPTGFVSTFNTSGPIQQNGAFFQSLGTNGRSCSTCHLSENGMGLSTDSIKLKFLETRGRDPLFASFDGMNCPDGKQSDPASHSYLLKNGLIRIPLVLPTSVQFQIRAVRDPYGCALVKDPGTGAITVSVYRRPLPTTNLRYLSAVMFDGRETIQPLTAESSFQDNLKTDLMHQSVTATLTHAQAAVSPTIDQQTDIVNFELGLTSAQAFDFRAGSLSDGGATGGPQALSKQGYYPGVNDALGADPNHIAFNSNGFNLFSAWANQKGYGFGFFGGAERQAREDIAAGEVLFNTHPLTISNVRGLNDNTALAAALGTTVPIGPFQGFCTTCHDTPNVGDHSLPLALDIGTIHDLGHEQDPLIANGVSQLSPATDGPVFEVTGCPNPFPDPNNPGAPYVVYTSDPGKALVSGLCSDLNRTKGPVLRGLASRAPYFHNGAAKNLTELINFYNQRFEMNLTDKEKAQLIAFLNAL